MTEILPFIIILAVAFLIWTLAIVIFYRKVARLQGSNDFLLTVLSRDRPPPRDFHCATCGRNLGPAPVVLCSKHCSEGLSRGDADPAIGKPDLLTDADLVKLGRKK